MFLVPDISGLHDPITKLEAVLRSADLLSELKRRQTELGIPTCPKKIQHIHKYTNTFTGKCPRTSRTKPEWGYSEPAGSAWSDFTQFLLKFVSPVKNCMIQIKPISNIFNKIPRYTITYYLHFICGRVVQTLVCASIGYYDIMGFKSYLHREPTRPKLVEIRSSKWFIIFTVSFAAATVSFPRIPFRYQLCS